MNKNVIYNVILGGYDDLHDPEIITPGWDHICFTDNKDLKSDTWDIRVIKKDENLSNAKMAKKVMILYHDYINNYNISVCVPGYSVIKINLDFFIKDKFGAEYIDYDMAILRHPKRRGHCVFEEATHLLPYYKNEISRNSLIYQIKMYKNDGMTTLIRSLPTGILIRRHHRTNLERHCNLWWNEILKYSDRDQISLGYILWKYKLIKYKTIGFGYFKRFFMDAYHHNSEALKEVRNVNPQRN